MDKNLKLGALSILMAGSLWGFLGLTCKTLTSYGLTSFDVSFFRIFVGALFLLLYMVIKDIKLLRIDRKGLIFTAIAGLVSQSLANGFYFASIERTSITTAVILLYTAPIFTNIISKFIYQEVFTKLKVVAVILCFSGVFLTATGGDLNTLKLNFLGLLIGLASGLTFGLMPILNKFILEKYNPWTILFYSFLWGSFFILLLARPLKIFSLNLDFKFWFALVFLGLVLAVIGYGLYLKGLKFGVEPSKATIISTVEIVVSVIVAYFVFKESINIYNILGILMVAASVILIQERKIIGDKQKVLAK
ncbi:Permease of the drug/metabolite transporter (DMT) superfamily [Desulfonispora thiosulfatigenes DSM 11270]|uniref:Permease of the drug/metabolite transporter (DMT) superfamily n=1 Tax=Desulfonispora thiosulfatigenes DSM 11270 TaxID=656914 RepID=A0A1W1VLJ6_DESTI|nr:DMT family transporter [Desulfonispora thiosulfatigenes]SMB93921.1 Permease of the drug/metabolite transporter (DMT) superfamily [Desulfonispora thiosulfatigenes DSM 11270]